MTDTRFETIGYVRGRPIHQTISDPKGISEEERLERIHKHLAAFPSGVFLARASAN